MKASLAFFFLFFATIFFSGCYTILHVEESNEPKIYAPIEITIIVPRPIYPIDIVTVPPCPEPPISHPITRPIITPRPQPIPVIHRPIHTGRDSFVSNPPDHGNNRPTRDSGIKRGENTISNPAPARDNENNNGTRNSGDRTGRR